MFLMLPRPTQIVNISATTNNVNLYTTAGSPTFPLNLLCFINANVGSSSSATPAFQTGTGWIGGSLLYIDNNATITGGTGSPGSTGSTGTTGTNGAGGAGGAGGPGGPGGGGSPGNTGGTGGTGGTGNSGGISLSVATITGLITQIDNAGSSIIGGPGGNLGSAGVAGGTVYGGNPGGPGGLCGSSGPPGPPGSTGPSGTRGTAVSGNSNIRWINTGTITG
jgi:hypothetical protein